MSKNLTNQLLSQINSGELSQKPKWHFVLTSLISVATLLLTTSLSMISLSLIIFRLTHPGFGATQKLALILATLPWYLPLLVIAGLVLSYLLLKRYDFSYRRNFGAIILIFIVGIILGSIIMDRLGIDEILTSRGYFGRLKLDQPVGRQPGFGRRFQN